MDFELDDGDEVFAQSLISEDDDLDVDLDMDFNLDDGFEDSEDIQASDEDEIAVDVVTDEDVILNENVELALDEFEDVLGGAVGTKAQDLAEVEPGEEVELDIEFDDEKATAETDEMDADGIDLLLDDTEEVEDSNISDADLGIDNDTTSAVPEAEGDDLDLSGLDALLDEEVDDSAVEGSESEEVELSLDGDLDLEEEPASQKALNEADATITTSPQADIDDLDLADLDDLLGVDGELDDTTVSKGEQLDLDDDLELSLDDEAVLEDVLDESEATALSDDAQGDDLDLAGLDDLLDEDAGQVEGAVSEGEELSLDDDLELSLDEEPELDSSVAPAVTASQDNRDEFDLSDFEDLLGEDAAPEEDAAQVDLNDGIALESESVQDSVTNDMDDFDMSEIDGLLLKTRLFCLQDV